MKLSIIVPAYNEEKRIANTLEKYFDFFSKKYGNGFEVLVMMDGCTDKTPQIVKEFSKRHRQVKYENHLGKLGKGIAIVNGFKKAKGDIVSFIDADGSTEPPDMYRIINELENSHYDGAIASRYVETSSVTVKQKIMRRIVSRGFNIMVRLLFGLPYRDTQCWAKAYRKYVVKNIINDIGITEWVFDVNILYAIHKKGYVIKEVPITWKNQEGSKFKMRMTVPMMFLALIRFRLKKSPLGKYIR